MSEENATKTETTEEEVAVKTPTREAFPALAPGYTVRLHIRVSEGKKDRIQIFEGIILKIGGSTPATKMITVRKVSKGFGVEKIIPLAMPSLEKIEIVKKARVRQSKLYYLRGHKKRLSEELVIKK